MSHRHVLALALALPVIASALVACGDAETLDDGQLRAVNVKDNWGLHGTTHFPDVNSCDDYYNDLCVGLSSSMCTIAKNRYSCTQASQGVWVTDTYGTFAAAQAERTWEGVSVGGESGSGELASPDLACGAMLGIDKERCAQLASIAETLDEHRGEILDFYPQGGFAQLIVTEDHFLLTSPDPDPDDLVWQTASALDWTAPVIEGGYELPNAGYVFEEHLMLAIRPNGTMSLSSPEAAFTQSVVEAEPLDLGALGKGECLELDGALTRATAKAWTLGKGVSPKVIIEDHLLLTSVFEDDIIMRVSGPASASADTLDLAAATLLLDSPSVANNCDGFCDGLCLDGECYMNLPPYSLSAAGVCAD